MKSNLILIVFFLSIVVSCKTEKSKTLNFGIFNITVPDNWKKIEIKGVDSYVGGIVLNEKDTLFFDYGSSTALINDAIVVEDIKNLAKMKQEGFSVESLTFSKTPNLDQNQGIFHKEYYMYDTISGYTPKIKVPKRIGDGVTAICFDSLNTKKERLYLYAKNLDTIKQFELLKAFKTIKIISNSESK